MDNGFHEQLRAFIDSMPFLKQFDLQITRAERGVVEISMNPAPHLLNHLQKYQAGASFTLAEITGRLACVTFLETPETYLVTKRVEIYYIHPADQPLTAAAEITTGMMERALSTLHKKNKTSVIVEVLIKNKDQKPVVRSSAEYYFRRGTPDGSATHEETA